MAGSCGAMLANNSFNATHTFRDRLSGEVLTVRIEVSTRSLVLADDFDDLHTSYWLALFNIALIFSKSCRMSLRNASNFARSCSSALSAN